ncbi:MAG: helicase-exonuclease AddAB subunit AddB [Candidatus Improbicoccus pseudotrichonymphae]|uniref:Helicase-exonuclease AddAB subunit AddB n=1 Tax=Candidatus Improbicoccus pseudotrichonymphae TaxID=3033792 RepID=A0AA48I2M0_9FIRM|nr:MAG: helicase-exonuclease AddAB subunit AddB [Candidatus Improbicoccus pseudotrichonymphae]
MVNYFIVERRLKILNFILSPSGYGKTLKIKKAILRETKIKNNVILLVPEKKSFEIEYDLINFLGEENFKFVKVLTFKRFLKFVYRYLGNINVKFMQKSIRNILMRQSIDETKSGFEFFNKNSNSFEIINIFKDIIREIKNDNLTAPFLKKEYELMENKNLKKKLNDVLLVFEKYEKIIKEKNDSINELFFLHKLVKNNNFFKNFKIFIDEFFYFTPAQLNIIETMILQTDVTIAFKYDSLNREIKNGSVFNWYFLTENTTNKILDSCKKINLSDINILFLDKKNAFSKSDELRILEQNIFRIDKKTIKNENITENILIYEASNKYDECDFVARSIKKMIMQDNYRYRDFLIVILEDTLSYEILIKKTLNNYDIPYFLDKNEPIYSKNLMILIFSSLDFIISNFETENLFKYLKTSFSGFLYEDVCIIENYCRIWKINGKSWFNDFRFLKDKKSEKEFENLNYINNLRKKIISPFVNFKKKLLKNENIFKIFYEFLMEINLPETIKKKCETLTENNRIIAAEEQLKIWNILIESLEEISHLFLNKKIDLKYFRECIEISIKSKKISFIPKYEDEVIIDFYGEELSGRCNIIFTLGDFKNKFLNENKILNLDEIKKAADKNLKSENTIDKMLSKELFLMYSLLTSATEKIFICSKKAKNNLNTNNEIIKEIKKVFTNVEVKSYVNYSLEDYCWTEKNSFLIYCKYINNFASLNHQEKNIIFSLKKHFQNNEKYKRKLNLFDLKKSEQKIEKIEIFNKNEISVSEIEKFYLCKFAYFFKYMLKIRNDFNYFKRYNLFNNFLIKKNFKNNNIDKNKILEDIYELFKTHLNIDEKKQNARYKYLISRQTNLIVSLIENFKKYFKKNEIFVLNRIKTEEFQEINLEKNLNIKIINSKNDNLNIIEHKKNKYLGLINFKFRQEKLNLNKIFEIENFKALMYLKAIKENKIFDENHKSLSGIFNFYFDKNATKSYDFHHRDDSEEMTNIKKDALILRNSDCVEETKKTKLINTNEFKLVDKYLRDSIFEMVSEIKETNFFSGRSPKCKDKKMCLWCDYKDLCKQKINLTTLL